MFYLVPDSGCLPEFHNPLSTQIEEKIFFSGCGVKFWYVVGWLVLSVLQLREEQETACSSFVLAPAVELGVPAVAAAFLGSMTHSSG